MITIITAVDNNGGIGLNGKLPWHVPAELAHFHRTVANMVTVCGVKTYHTLPRPLRVRTMVWSEGGWDGVEETFSADNVLELGRFNNIAIIGGAATYAAFLPYADKIMLSWVSGDYEVDTYFPHTIGANGERVFPYHDLTQWEWTNGQLFPRPDNPKQYVWGCWEIVRKVQPCP
jgi:dihydrofolate reductase